MTVKKWFALALVMMMVMGLVGGVAVASNDVIAGNEVIARPYLPDILSNFYIMDRNNGFEEDSIMNSFSAFIGRTSPFEFMVYAEGASGWEIVYRSGEIQPIELGLYTQQVSPAVFIPAGSYVGLYFRTNLAIPYTITGIAFESDSLDKYVLFTNQGGGETDFVHSGDRMYSIAALGSAIDYSASYPAAPAIAAELLKDAGVSPRYGERNTGGNYIADLAKHMGDNVYFDGVCKYDTKAYRDAVAMFLCGLGADIDCPGCGVIWNIEGAWAIDSYWDGRDTDEWGGKRFLVVIEQDSMGNFSGEFGFTHDPETGKVLDVTGNVTGSFFTMQLVVGSDIADFDGVIANDGKSIAGNWTYPGSAGTWFAAGEATKIEYCKAAPTVAAQLLKDAEIEHRFDTGETAKNIRPVMSNYIAEVARHMGPGPQKIHIANLIKRP